jgi:integrase
MVVEIKRAWTHGEIKETKTPASEAIMPMPKEMADAILHYRTRPESKSGKWLFPATRGDKPRWTGIMLQDHIAPVAKKLGMPHIGFHTFRHSYRAWLGGGDATLSQQKDLMRHSSIGVTMRYGGTPVEEMRPLVNAVAAKLRLARRSSR